jgi:ketosteroid isomerase-like protein
MLGLNPAYNSGPMPRAHRPPVAPLERRLREFWALFDAKDYEALLAMMTVDSLETDDFAKVWLRGHAAISENYARIGEFSEDSHTVLRDVRVTETSAMAVVTCVVHYQMRWRGQPTSVDAPTTMFFVRESGVWRVALLHTR